MRLQLTIVRADGQPIPAGSLLRIEVRDTSLADAPAVLLERVDRAVPRETRTTAMSVAVDLAAVPDGSTVWAHLDVDGDGRVSQGDFVSVESYPVRPAPVQETTIRITAVR